MARALVRSVFALCGAVVVVVGLAGCPEDAPALPVERALGGTEGRQRFVVTLDLPAVDLAEYRALLKDHPSEVAGYVEKKRAGLAAALQPVEAQLSGLGGRVVERWWMSNQATIEMQASAAATIQGVAGVKKLEIDQPLQ